MSTVEFGKADGVTITGDAKPRYDEVLTADAIEFVAELERKFRSTRDGLLLERAKRQVEIDQGAMFSFLDSTKDVRESNWTVLAPPDDLADRRCEITGPPDRRMAINAANSGARIWMADFEDSSTPTFDNLIQGQLNLQDIADRTIDFETDEGRRYELNEKIATIVVRPRGWHLWEKHFLVDDVPVTAALFDFGLHTFHSLAHKHATPMRPYYYLPKMESHLEARLWNDVFTHAEEHFGAPSGTVRATVLIETIPAAFEMDEILFELHDHAAGLNAGRWDYLFSIIKKFRNRGERFLLPNRNDVTMAAPFMRAYSDLLVQTCHRRGAHAIGGMAAFIPSRRDAEVNAVALEKVRNDKEREARAGFDGSWVAHPDLVEVCSEVFDSVIGSNANQLEHQRPDVSVTADELVDLTTTPGEITEDGIRNNTTVALQYLASWLRGLGAVGVLNLMEDVATAEISRSQLWQWRNARAHLASGDVVSDELVRRILGEEFGKLRQAAGANFDEVAYERARTLYEGLVLGEEFPEFLTLSAYDEIL